MRRFFTCFIVFVFVSSLSVYGKTKNRLLEISSPTGLVKVQFLLKDGLAFYKVNYQNKLLIKDSRLGFALKDLPAIDKDFKIVSAIHSSFDETWSQPWGEVKNIRNHYNNLLLTLEEQSNLKRKVVLEFRVYDDGLGFRYEIPKQPNLQNFVIMDELTEFVLTQDFSSWWIPAYGTEMDSEYLYKNSKLSEIKEKVCTPITF
jgi:alpha-glucosidase